VTGDCGILVPSRDPDGLAGAIRSLAADRPAARSMGMAGRARVEAHFTIERMVHEYAEVYRAVSTRTRDSRRGTPNTEPRTRD
jgi:glycosyltransferase involved in cell wall biosynthesis